MPPEPGFGGGCESVGDGQQDDRSRLSPQRQSGEFNARWRITDMSPRSFGTEWDRTQKEFFNRIQRR